MERRLREARSYARRRPIREGYAFVLLVCEGSKSEPAYFFSLCRAYRLSSANIHVMSSRGTDPMSIVRVAEDKASDYDKVFCVFDRNGHANYDEALTAVRNSPHGRSGKLSAITSWPCFELWLLLHFRYSTAPFNRSGNNSSCDHAVRELKEFIPDYKKGHPSIFDITAGKLMVAIGNSKRLEAYNKGCGSLNPDTKMHALVEYLTKLRG